MRDGACAGLGNCRLLQQLRRDGDGDHHHSHTREIPAVNRVSLSDAIRGGSR